MPKDMKKTGINIDTIYEEFTLELNDSVWIGETQLNFLNSCSKWGAQAKLGLSASSSINIYRLEVFARKSQCYQQYMSIDIGETLILDNIKIDLVKKIGGSVLFRIQTSENIYIRKSFFNNR